MKAPPISTLLGVAAMLFGGWWIWGAFVQPIAKSFTEENELRDYLFMFTMMPVLALPGIFAAYFGFRLPREKAPRNFKGVVGWLAVLAVFWISSQLEQVTAVQVDEKIATTLFTFLATIVVIPLYAILTAWLMRREGITVNGARSMIGRGAILLVAMEIWQLGSGLFDAYSPIKQGYSNVHEEPWESLRLVVPIASAYLFYKLANWLIANGAGEPPDRRHSLDQNEISDSIRL